MPDFRNDLPQMSGDIFLTDAGIETDLIFNHGIEIREFAAHTLLPETEGRDALANYFDGFLKLATERDVGFILDSQTWKAHMHWADDLGASENELKQANNDAIAFIAGVRDKFADLGRPIVLNGVIGPRGDAYAPEAAVAADEAEAYHSKQIGWLADTDADMVTALTFTQADEATGLVRAAQAKDMPVVVSFTLETDGRLPTGQPLGDAIEEVDAATDNGAAYFMINCAHPDHFMHVLDGADWTRRVRGLRCNASRLSHAELDACDTLDHGNPEELGRQYKAIHEQMPWMNVFGGCCGSDLRHVAQVAQELEI